MGAQTNMLTPHSVLQLALADVGLLSAGHGGGGGVGREEANVILAQQ